MILGCDPEKVRVIGGQYTGYTHNGNEYPEGAFKILRQATLEEWLEQQARLGQTPTQTPEELAAALFYECEAVTPDYSCPPQTAGG